MAKLQILVDEMIVNLNVFNPELQVAIHFNLAELQKLDKKESKKQLSSCMILVAREEKILQGKIHLMQVAISNLEKKDRLNFKKSSENRSVNNLKTKLVSLEDQNKRLTDLWNTMNEQLLGLERTTATSK
jgi:hypothetical protein